MVVWEFRLSVDGGETSEPRTPVEGAVEAVPVSKPSPGRRRTQGWGWLGLLRGRAAGEEGLQERPNEPDDAPEAVGERFFRGGIRPIGSRFEGCLISAVSGGLQVDLLLDAVAK